MSSPWHGIRQNPVAIFRPMNDKTLGLLWTVLTGEPESGRSVKCRGAPRISAILRVFTT